MTESNPAESDVTHTESPQQRVRLGLLLLVAPFVLYPVIAVLSVYLVCYMEISLGMHGAILGSFKTPLGIAFTFAAVLHIGFPLWSFLGLVGSLFLRDALTPTRSHIPYVAAYMICCAIAVTLGFVDPGGYFEYFYD